MQLIYVLLSIKSQEFLPVELPDRKDLSKIKLSAIGDFGLIRKARSKISAHYHTGIDIKRPNNKVV